MADRGGGPAASVAGPAGAMRNWLGEGKHFLVYPVRAGQLLNTHGTALRLCHFVRHLFSTSRITEFFPRNR
jgi:hypothetical protein